MAFYSYVKLVHSLFAARLKGVVVSDAKIYYTFKKSDML